jgi:hypothetical protein
MGGLKKPEPVKKSTQEEGEALNSDLRSRATAFLRRASGPAREALDGVPMLLEYSRGSEPVARTWSEFVRLVLSRYLSGAALDDPEVKNNLAVILMGLDGATEDDSRECREILEGVWAQSYGG